MMKTIRQAKPTTLNPESAHTATVQAKGNMTDKLAGSAKAKEKFDMKYHVIIHHWGGGASIMSHRNKTEFCERIAKKHKLDLAKKNLQTNEFKAVQLCNAGDIWNLGRVTK